MTANKLLVYLFRRDLRVADNAILHHLASTTDHGFTHLLPVFVFPHNQIELSGLLKKGEQNPFEPARSEVGKFWRCGPHRARFLAQAVWDLKQSLEAHNSGLIIRAGDPAQILDHLVHHLKEAGGISASAVWMTEDVAHEEVREQESIAERCAALGLDFKLCPDEKYFIDDRDIGFKSADELPDVFTTYRKSQEPLRSKPRPSLPALESPLPSFPSSQKIPSQEAPFEIPNTLADLERRLLAPLTASLLNPPTAPEDAKTVHPFTGGETNAIARLKSLIQSGAMSHYADTRNGLLGTDFSTKLSAYLALGCISARQIHDELMKLEDGTDKAYQNATGFSSGENAGTKAIRLELLWRDYMRLCTKKFGAKLFRLGGFRQENGYEKKWKTADIDAAETGQQPPPQAVAKILTRFLEGSTGMGLIDASQRELYLTGYTSNRARQNVASFFSKHLGLDWRYGAEWYESMLVDYDVSSNWANWQYVAGVGNDPRGDARIFNPVKQAFDYDKDGDYVRTWVSEVKGLENVENVFQVWTSSAEDLKKHGLSDNIMVTDPLKRIDFTVDRKPKTPRRPYQRGRGGGGQGGGRGNRRGSMGMNMGYGRGVPPPPLQMMPMTTDDMGQMQMAGSPPMYAPPVGYEQAYAWSPTMAMAPVHPPPPHWGGPPPMGNNGWVVGTPMYGDYMQPAPAGYSPQGGHQQGYVRRDGPNRGQ